MKSVSSLSSQPVSPAVPSKVAAEAVALNEQIHSRELFGSARELMIEHAGCVYRLRITQNNKLILTK